MWRRKRKNRKEKEEADFARRQRQMDALKAKKTQLLAKETTLNEKELRLS